MVYFWRCGVTFMKIQVWWFNDGDVVVHCWRWLIVGDGSLLEMAHCWRGTLSKMAHCRSWLIVEDGLLSDMAHCWR